MLLEMQTKHVFSLVGAVSAAIFLSACTGGQWFTPQSPIGSAPIAALTALVGTTTSGAIRTAGPSFVQNVPQNVQILDEAPPWEYVEVGYVEAQHGPMITATGVYEALQWRAASIGADAVIVDKPFMKYRGKGDDYIVSKPIKGIAIASPKNVSGGERRVQLQTTPFKPH